MLANPKDVYIGLEIIIKGTWETYLTNLLNNILEPDMIVIDVGANIGYHTLTMSKLVGSNGRVYAFEPSKINHDILLYNCMLNKCNNVSIIKAGCDKVCSTMFIDSKWNTSNEFENYGCIVLKSEKNCEEDESIATVTIDSLNLKRLDFIKIDAEYMEEAVIIGAIETIKTFKPIMIVEIHQTEMPQMLQLIQSINYHLTHIGGYDFLAVPN